MSAGERIVVTERVWDGAVLAWRDVPRPAQVAVYTTSPRHSLMVRWLDRPGPLALVDGVMVRRG